MPLGHEPIGVVDSRGTIQNNFVPIFIPFFGNTLATLLKLKLNINQLQKPRLLKFENSGIKREHFGNNRRL